MKHPFDDADGGLTAPTMKPKFLTKAEREQLALERRQKEFEEQKKCQKLLHPQSNTSPDPKASDRDPDCSSHDRERDRDKERERERASRKEQDREREREAEEKAREQAEKLAERERDKELEAIKEQYLGSKKPKKRVIKLSEKFRFSFD